jgi:hypothetical protein
MRNIYVITIHGQIFPGSRHSTPKECREWIAAFSEMPWPRCKYWGARVKRLRVSADATGSCYQGSQP